MGEENTMGTSFEQNFIDCKFEKGKTTVFHLIFHHRLEKKKRCMAKFFSKRWYFPFIAKGAELGCTPLTTSL